MANPLERDLDHVLAETAALWDALRGARVFVTGGTGFFGCWLLESFLHANDRLHLGASVVVLTRNRRAFAGKAPHVAVHPAVTLHDGDVRDFAFPSGAFTHVIHAAADGGMVATPQDRLRMFETIVEGTRRTLELARRSGAKRFLLTSSGAVYGPQPPDLQHLGEDYAGAPDPACAGHAYGEAKRAAETQCALNADATLEPAIARCFAFVGPYLPLDASFAVGNFVGDALRGGPIRISGDGTAYRSYLYAADLAIWLWTILLRGQPCRPYNVGSERALTIRELAETVRRTVNADASVDVALRAAPGTRPARYVPATARARTELGLRELVPLEQGIRQMQAWYREKAAA